MVNHTPSHKHTQTHTDNPVMIIFTEQDLHAVAILALLVQYTYCSFNSVSAAQFPLQSD